MSGSVSKTILIGNLGSDPEIKNNGSGKSFAILSVATGESWKDKDTGERKQRTEWHRCVVFAEPLVRFAEHHLKKGMKVYLEGQNRTRKWEKNGVDMWTTEIVLDGFSSRLESMERLDGSGRPPPPESTDDYGTSSSRQPAPAGDDQFGGDDIPF